MVAFSRQHLIAKSPAWGAAAAGVAVALVTLVTPGMWVEGAVAGSGLPVLVPAAQPPLGDFARVVLALFGGAVAAAVAWAALYLLFGADGALAAPEPGLDGAPAVRRADAHPDAPPRRPLTVAELEEPPARAEPGQEDALAARTSSVIERDVPANLDVPLAAFDPEAIPTTPREPVRPLAPLAPGERLQTFPLAPSAPPPADPPAEPPSIEALLRRLEQGAERRRSVA